MLLFVLGFAACSKNEELSLVPITELYPLQVGKVFYYRLDSTVVASNKQQLLKRSYNAKDSIESQYLDNTGRKTFRIFRYLRDTLTPISNNSNWKFTFTYRATFDTNRVEYVDNNLRFVTLTNPVKEGSQWKGTQYINTGFLAPYTFYDGWNFEYQNVGQGYTVKKGTIPDTYTVFQQDITSPNIPFNTANFQTKDYSIEVYAKGIGLIYKDFLHWVYQPSNYFQDESFGIRLSLIDNK